MPQMTCTRVGNIACASPVRHSVRAATECARPTTPAHVLSRAHRHSRARTARACRDRTQVSYTIPAAHSKSTHVYDARARLRARGYTTHVSLAQRSLACRHRTRPRRSALRAKCGARTTHVCKKGSYGGARAPAHKMPTICARVGPYPGSRCWQAPGLAAPPAPA
jgi:hypothetical protein